MRGGDLDFDVFHISGLVLLAVALLFLAVLILRQTDNAKAAIKAWAIETGLSDLRFESASLRIYPTLGKARTGDVYFRISAFDVSGMPVSGFVKCNTFCRFGRPPVIDSQLTRTNIGGFPVQLIPPHE